MLPWMPQCEIIMPCGFGTGADNRDRQQGPSDMRWVSEISAPCSIFTFSEYRGCFVLIFKGYFASTCTLYTTYSLFCILHLTFKKQLWHQHALPCFWCMVPWQLTSSFVAFSNNHNDLIHIQQEIWAQMGHLALLTSWWRCECYISVKWSWD